MNITADGSIRVQTGFLQVNESSNTKTKEIIELVKTGEEAITDTTGIILRYEDIRSTGYCARI